MTSRYVLQVMKDGLFYVAYNLHWLCPAAVSSLLLSHLKY